LNVNETSARLLSHDGESNVRSRLVAVSLAAFNVTELGVIDAASTVKKVVLMVVLLLVAVCNSVTGSSGVSR
jgi:hypothetical protein